MANQASGLLSSFLRKKRFNKAMPFINGKVLDYGCGIGLLSRYIPKDKYIGIDTDLESVNAAKKLNPGYKFFKIFNSAYKEIKKFGPFDTIVMLAVIEHLKEPKKILKELSKILSHFGNLIITTPHPASNNIYNLGSKMGFFSKEAKEQHDKLYNYRDLSEICSEIGMKIIKYQRFLIKMNQFFLIRHI